MSELTLLFILVSILVDINTIGIVRRFLRSFLLIKQNRKGAKDIAKPQPPIRIVLMTYIKPVLKTGVRRFTLYHRIYLAVLFTIPLRYSALIYTADIRNVRVLNLVGAICIIPQFLVYLIVRAQMVDGLRARFLDKKGLYS